MLTRRRNILTAGLALLLLGAAAVVHAQTRIRAGEELAYQVATPPVYPRGGPDRPVTWSQTIASNGATFLRIHFQRLNLPPGDYVTISNPDRAEVWTYTGRGPDGTGSFWSFAVQGNTALIELHGGPIGKDRRHGLAIDRIAHGTLPLYDDRPLPWEKVVCGTDDRENVSCHPTFVNPVARLLFQSGGSSFLCTGWLINGSNANTMITNNHCVDNQTEVSTVQALFNFRTIACAGGAQASTSTYSGGTFLRTNSGLDYTLFTLQGNPEPLWGEFTATNKTPAVGMVMILPQHPGGGLKLTGYWNNSAHTQRCTVATANASYSGATFFSQMGYSCDTEGGSSGSPVLEAATGRAIGLHHFGGVSSSPCLNAGTQMKNICSDAGSLLRCGSSSSCVPDGGVDDTLGETSCCSGFAVNGSTVCLDPADYNNGWASCSHICGTRPVNGCVPSGGIDDTLYSTNCCSGAAVPGSTWCLDPADYGDDWISCVQICQ
jgi:lysyl endopeptidase